nr:MFS transporter [Kibdelosporangium sp. MJ126-NF4]ADB02838.1 AzicY [Kibdelosporangium sp. MJ126-NF4]CEL14055.1 MDR-type permease [Kibdelosporangium sp. MJ126-NF4]CTQ88421.1 MDR-type permease [Kibdelosporangium sp. MJ126-NF4]
MERSRWGLVVAAGLAVFVAQLDATIVNIALPSIEDDLDTTTAAVQWVVLGYLTPIIGLGLCAGRWVDAVDPRRALALTCTGFALSTAAAGLAPGIGWLVAARVLQGTFGAVLLALSSVLATVSVRPDARARAFGVIMLFGTTGGVTGPVVGGQIVESLGWPWIFYLSIPPLAVVALLAAAQLPLGERLTWPRRRWLVEAATFGGGAVAVLFGLSLAVTESPVWMIVSVVAVPLIVTWYRGADAVPVRELLATRGVLGPHVALALVYVGIHVLILVLPFVLQHGMGTSPGTAGLVLLAYPVAALATSYGAGMLADRVGTRPVAVAGAAVITVGFVLVLLPNSGPADLFWRLAVVGAGFGMFNGQLQVFLMGNVPRARLGLTAATSSLVRQLGNAFGSAAGAALWAVSGSSALRWAAALAAVSMVCAGLIVARTRTGAAVEAQP